MREEYFHNIWFQLNLYLRCRSTPMHRSPHFSIEPHRPLRPHRTKSLSHSEKLDSNLKQRMKLVASRCATEVYYSKYHRLTADARHLLNARACDGRCEEVALVCVNIAATTDAIFQLTLHSIERFEFSMLSFCYLRVERSLSSSVYIEECRSRSSKSCCSSSSAFPPSIDVCASASAFGRRLPAESKRGSGEGLMVGEVGMSLSSTTIVSYEQSRLYETLEYSWFVVGASHEVGSWSWCFCVGVSSRRSPGYPDSSRPAGALPRRTLPHRWTESWSRKSRSFKRASSEEDAIVIHVHVPVLGHPLSRFYNDCSSLWICRRLKQFLQWKERRWYHVETMLFKLEAVTVLSLYVHPNESETRVTTGSFQQLQTGTPFLQATVITIQKKYIPGADWFFKQHWRCWGGAGRLPLRETVPRCSRCCVGTPPAVVSPRLPKVCSIRNSCNTKCVTSNKLTSRYL